MTTPEDPPRWSDGVDAPTALASLLSAAKRDTATDTELSELGARLEPTLGSPSARPLLKLAGGLIALLGLGAVVALRHSGPEPSQIASARSAVAPAVASAGLRSAPTMSALPNAAISAAPPEVDGPPSRPANGMAKKSMVGTTAPESRPVNAAQAEASLLEQARSALAASPARALSLTEQHAQQFPRGLLAQEREVIAISALRRLGRTTEAEARAARFDARYPHSAHQQAVDRPGTQ